MTNDEDKRSTNEGKQYRENAFKEVTKPHIEYKESQCGAVVEQKNLTMRDVGSRPAGDRLLLIHSSES